MLEKKILPNKHMWWSDPVLRKRGTLPSRQVRNTPVTEVRATGIHKHTLDFQPSVRWKRYVDLDAKDGGYITELYSLTELSKRYGLSFHTKLYWRKHILPEPFTLSSVKNNRVYFWSRIQLVVIDSVLRHLESNGILTIRKTDKSCLELIEHGSTVLEDYYKNMYEEQSLTTFDRFGVRKIL
jgi:predicted transcriptional regulator